MSPHLKDHDVEAVAKRLEAAGDGEAAALVRKLAAAVAGQDEALRDFVADAAELDELLDEGGSYVTIKSSPNGFEDLGKAFGYPSLAGFDRAAHARDAASPGGADYMSGTVHLTALDHFLARIWTEARPAADLVSEGYRPIEVGGGPRREVIYHHDGRTPAAEPEEEAAGPRGP